MVQVSCMISVERWARLCSYHEGFLSSVGGEGKQVTKLDGLSDQQALKIAIDRQEARSGDEFDQSTSSQSLSILAGNDPLTRGSTASK